MPLRRHVLSAARAFAAAAFAACINAIGAQTLQGAAIDAIVQSHMQARRIPGAAIAVVRNGRVVHEKAYGVANLETNSPVTLASVFQIASVTKPFTATAVMKLVDDGKVSLDAPISTYINEAPATWSGITTRRLLSHTAGIMPGAIVRVDAGGNLTNREGVPLSDVTARRTLEVLTRAPMLFEPGERSVYCDACFFLAGLVIERASGMSYPQFMQQRIFTPLGMTHSGIIDRWDIVPGLVPVYSLRDGKHAPWRRDWQIEVNAYAGIRATIGDLVRYDAALRAKSIVTSGSLDAMWSPSKLSNGRDAVLFGDGYGLGWGLGELRGRKTAEHAGASGTFLLRILDDDLTVIVLTNLDGPSMSQPAVLARAIAGSVNPAYAAPDRLPAQQDPSPPTSTTVRQLLADLAQGREAAAMTAGHREFYLSIPEPARDQDAGLLASLGTLEYLTSDEVSGRISRNGDPVARIVYYRGAAGGRQFVFTFWLTAEGKVAHLRFSPA